MYNLYGFTLSGMDHYFDLAKAEGNVDSTLFEDIQLYNGGTYYITDTKTQAIPPIDHDLIVDEIVERYGELFPYRQEPTRFKRMSDNFFKKNEKNFEKMWIALQLDFNPLFNYDRYEEWTDDKDYSSTTDDEGNVTTEKMGSETEKLDNSTGNYKEKYKDPETTVKHQNLSENSNGVKYTGVSADNAGSSSVTTASNYSPSTMEYETTIPTQDSVEIDTAGETSFEGKSYKVTSYGRDVDSADRRKDVTDTTNSSSTTGGEGNVHKGHLYGNIGVTTSTQMIKEVLELYDFDFYAYVADKYAKDLLIKIY